METTTRRFNFTEEKITKLPLPPKGKRICYWDKTEPRLVLVVTSTGTKTFQVYRKISGRPERITLGRHSDISIM